MYETVMSHPSKLAELQHARATGYTVVVIPWPSKIQPSMPNALPFGSLVVDTTFRRTRSGNDMDARLRSRQRRWARGPGADLRQHEARRRWLGPASDVARRSARAADGRAGALGRHAGSAGRRTRDRVRGAAGLREIARTPLMQAPLSTAVSRGTIVDRGGAAHRESFYLQHDPRSMRWSCMTRRCCSTSSMQARPTRSPTRPG